MQHPAIMSVLTPSALRRLLGYDAQKVHQIYLGILRREALTTEVASANYIGVIGQPTWTHRPTATQPASQPARPAKLKPAKKPDRPAKRSVSGWSQPEATSQPGNQPEATSKRVEADLIAVVHGVLDIIRLLSAFFPCRQSEQDGRGRRYYLGQEDQRR
jgi:hypothetical protein